MSLIAQFLNSVYTGERFRIVETGCASTSEIAAWVGAINSMDGPAVQFHSVDLNGTLQLSVHDTLAAQGLAKYVTFHTQAPEKFLGDETWMDVAFLNSPDLQMGEIEFDFAASAGARMIVARDFQLRAALAVRKAAEIGWDIEHFGMYSVLKRPA